jgi:hypothetical protein
MEPQTVAFLELCLYWGFSLLKRANMSYAMEARTAFSSLLQEETALPSTVE